MLVSPPEVVAKAKATIKECSVADVHNAPGPAPLVIDVREPAEFQRGHLPGAIPIPRGMLEFDILPTLEKLGGEVAAEDRDIVLYCGTGGRSALAAQSLDAMGFRNVRSMDGGIVAWAEARFPLETPAA